MNPRQDWSDPTLREQIRAVCDPEPKPALPSFSDVILNAITFAGLIGAVVFVVLVILGLIG